VLPYLGKKKKKEKRRKKNCLSKRGEEVKNIFKTTLPAAHFC
jgi:hypothetical protein